MTKYFAVPALLAVFFTFTSCVEIAHAILVGDDDTVCGEDVQTTYQPVSPKALAMTAPLDSSTILVFVNEQGTEMKMTVQKIQDDKARLNYKMLCSNYSYNTMQYEYCASQMLNYEFRNEQYDAEISYYWFLDHSEEMIYDRFRTTIGVGNFLGGYNTWVADTRSNPLSESLLLPNEYERTVGDTTLLGRPFQNVTYHNWGVNKGKGFFFQKGVGVVAMWAENRAFWVLVRVE
jgi:hypothetical protein